MVALRLSRSKRDFGPTRVVATFPVMNRRVVVALIGVFVVGALIGVVVALAANSSSDSDEPAAPSEAVCAEAAAVVDGANERFRTIASAEAEPDATFLAGLLTEQGAIAYVMEAEPECFSLADRAAAIGLRGAIEALIAVSEIVPAEAPPPGTIIPGDQLLDPDEDPPATDPGE